MAHPVAVPRIARIPVATLAQVFWRGWSMFVRTRPLSVSFSMIFALIGVAILASITRASYAPFVFPVSGGFMLLGPFLLAGYFGLADRLLLGEPCAASDIRKGFARTNGGILVIALFCTLLFVCWVINAAYLYGSIVGRAPVPLYGLLAPSDNVVVFLVRSSLTGTALAFVVFAVSAFSVPLLYYRRAALVPAVSLSIRAVLVNLLPCVLWSLLLTVLIVVSILIFPLFLVAFPVLAYASHALYREVFPETA